jgi:hypothetical protein
MCGVCVQHTVETARHDEEMPALPLLLPKNRRSLTASAQKGIACTRTYRLADAFKNLKNRRISLAITTVEL